VAGKCQGKKILKRSGVIGERRKTTVGEEETIDLESVSKCQKCEYNRDKVSQGGERGNAVGKGRAPGVGSTGVGTREESRGRKTIKT